MDKVITLTYSSSLTNLCDVNSSFDSGVLRIAYAGENRNKTCIEKATFERCLKTIYNCPIVCHYDRDTDSVGGHDMELVCSDDGSMSLVNLTQPIGVIPESANVFWETVEEDNGVKHDYLCAEALLWKRQEAYKKIKKDGFSAQSMEIKILDGELVDEVYKINDFEFNAFTIIGCEPCFESASLNFSQNAEEFKEQLSQMMQEIGTYYSQIATSNEVDNNNNTKEGGDEVLETQTNLVNENQEQGNEQYKLESNIRDELWRCLETVTIDKPWGVEHKYCMVDYDAEQLSVYAWDTEDWLLYGFAYVLDGDAVKIDFDSKKRKKFDITDFEGGEQPDDEAVAPIQSLFNEMEERLTDNADMEAKYQTASDAIASMEKELGELRQFKAEADAMAMKAKRDEVFAEFTDLDGIEEFETLKASAENFDVEGLEEKCFAIRGRHVEKPEQKFSRYSHIRVPVSKDDMPNRPYGGLFEEYDHKY